MLSFYLPKHTHDMTGAQVCQWLIDMLMPHVGSSSHVCWLKNAGQDVIGLFPAWCISHRMSAHGSCKVSHRQFNQLPHYVQHDVNATPEDLLSDYLYTFEPCTFEAFAHEEPPKKADAQSPHNRPQNAQSTHPNPPQYLEGLMGFVGYDYAGFRTAGVLHELPDNRPSLFFGHYDMVIKRAQAGWRLQTNQLNAHQTRPLTANQTQNRSHSQPQDQLKNKAYEHHASKAPLATTCIQWLSSVLQSTHTPAQKPAHLHHFSYHWEKSQYLHAFSQVQDYLHAGDCYQVNLAQRLHSGYTGSAHHLLSELDSKTHAPYAGYLQVGDFELICCSPELFLSFQKQPTNQEKGVIKSTHEPQATQVGGADDTHQPLEVVTKPIKGTLPRLANPQADAQQIDLLAASDKNRAENLMIVDLLRNDLSKYAKTGSVHVPKLFEIESFAQVHHMVSTIEAELHPEADPFDVLMSALPGGSITGAPKIRAIEIIQELEGQPRGAYCGSLGYLNFDGTGEFNILIRSLEFWQGKMQLWAGGGITVASDADDEYQECMDKISGIVEVLEKFAR